MDLHDASRNGYRYYRGRCDLIRFFVTTPSLNLLLRDLIFTMLPLRLTRQRLGFLEHIETISIARYPDRSPCINWNKAVDLWSVGSGSLRKIETGLTSLWSTFFVCDGNLPLHVDMIGKNMTTMGMIIANESPILITTEAQKVAADACDIFALDPEEEHGAETHGRFIFATRDLKNHELPTVEKARRLFLRDLARISEHLERASYHDLSPVCVGHSC